MAYLVVNGVNIYYEKHGSGPPVLLSHGYAACGAMWQPQTPALTPRYRLISWDMRGHGRSDSPEAQEEYSEAKTVQDMRALLDSLGIQRAVLCGMSLGGYMSLAFCREHPQRVSALVLVGAGPGFRNPARREEWNVMALARADKLEREGLDALGESSEVRLTRPLHRSAAGLARAARGMLTQVDDRVIASLEQMHVPTVVVVGAEDTPFLAAADYMASKIPGARKVVIPNAGHAANIDQPELFNQTVLEFLGGLQLA